MRRVVHISDLHFGNNDSSLLEPLCETIVNLKPDLVVISGDLVEHATRAEFLQARAFLDRLPQPQIVVPGNHDLPFYNFFERSLFGLDRYKNFITPNTSPEYVDDEIAVVGANTSRIWPLRGGSLSSSQLLRLETRFRAFPEYLTRILVTHHPFDLPAAQGGRLIVGHARRSVARLAPVVDILLAGHIHLSSTGSTATRYKTQGHAIAFIQAGTAVSNRNKGEENSFNLLRIAPTRVAQKAVSVDRFSWRKEEACFACQHSASYHLGKEGWAADKAEPTAEVHEVGPSQPV
jgi:3',5'-cyclic AMP phosphodiesterase CpdA